MDELRYSPAAVSARIAGVVSASVDFDHRGAIGSVDIKGHPLLASGVVAALRSAQATAACSGRKVQMQFSFVIDQNLVPTTPASVSKVSAVDYKIVAPAPVIEVTITDPAWTFNRRGRFLHHLKMALTKLQCW